MEGMMNLCYCNIAPAFLTMYYSRHLPHLYPYRGSQEFSIADPIRLHKVILTQPHDLDLALAYGSVCTCHKNKKWY